ncbi:MAG: glycoside hydrolase family 28 protein [Eubacteriales bacterium]
MSIVNVKNFATYADGVHLDTKAIQEAINSISDGDTLLFENGIFVTGTLALRSNITIRIMPDAEICASRNIKDYRDCGFYHNEMKETVSLFYALGCENITFEGGGKIQLNGDAFAKFDVFLPSEVDPATFTLEHEEQTVVGMKKRPTQPIFFNDCKNITFRNIRIMNSPCWTLVFSNSENIMIDSIYVDNHPRIPNNDGIHCTASKNITVKDSIFLCGDDCFAATCITNPDRVCENITISNCLMSSRSAAIRFGHLSGKVRNITVDNIKILPSNRAIAIFAADDGYVKNVEISNVVAHTSTKSGGWWGKGEGFVICAANSTGEISDITIKDCKFTEENPSVIAGKDGNVHDVTVCGCRFKKAGGNANPYYDGKMDLQPNIPKLIEAPYAKSEKLYVDGAKNITVR